MSAPALLWNALNLTLCATASRLPPVIPPLTVTSVCVWFLRFARAANDSPESRPQVCERETGACAPPPATAATTATVQCCPVLPLC
jgi:hypothetical protein